MFLKVDTMLLHAEPWRLPANILRVREDVIQSFGTTLQLLCLVKEVGVTARDTF